MKKNRLFGLAIQLIGAAVMALALASCPNEIKSDKPGAPDPGDPGITDPGTFYTVTYHKNGVDIDVPAAQSAAAGSTVNVALLEEYDPETATMIFNGWNTEDDGSGTLYVPGAPLKVDENIDLYAEWAGSGGGILLSSNTLTLEHYELPEDSDISTTMYLMRGLIPGALSSGKIEDYTHYNISYAYTSDVPIDIVNISLADASMEYRNDIRSINGSPAVGDSYIPANILVSGTKTIVSAQHTTAPNESAMANCLLFTAMYIDGEPPSKPPTLTFTKLKLEKADVPTLVSVIANGSSKAPEDDPDPTTEIILAFDKPVPGLTMEDIHLDTFDTEIKNELTNYGTYAILSINPRVRSTTYPELNDEIFFVYIKNTNLKVSGAKSVVTHRRDNIFEYIRSTAFLGTDADGKQDKTTEKLTLKFTKEISGISRDDIIITGINVTKGVLSAPVHTITDCYYYTLPISGFNMSGTIAVSVKPVIGGEEIECYDSWSPVSIYYYYAPEENYDDITYDGFIGRGYDVLRSEYFRSTQVKTNPALNMPKLIAHNKLSMNPYNNTQTTTINISGTTLEKYAEDFSFKASLSGSAGFFSASASFGYNSSKSFESYYSFAQSRTEVIKEKHYLQPISLSDLRENYLDKVFQEDWLNAGDAKELFENYGTHIFLTAYLGGRMEMSYEIENTMEQSSEEIDIHIKARYATVSGTADTTQTTEASKNQEKYHEKIESIGGTVGYNFNTYESAQANYGLWADSIQNSKQLQLVRGGNLKAVTEMVPIWELVSPTNTARRSYLINEYNNLLLENGLFLSGLQKDVPNVHIKGVYTGAGKPEAVAKSALTACSPDHMNIVEGDLNASAGGYYVCIGYTETANANEGVADLKAYATDSTPSATKVINGITYYLFGNNLNEGTTGVGIYLYAAYVGSSPLSPLKKLFVEIGGDISGMDGTSWERVLWTNGGWANINETNSGDRLIYIWMQR